MDCAFSDNCLNDLGIADRLSSYLAVTNQAFGNGVHAPMAFDLDHRSQHRCRALLGDLDEFFRQRTHLLVTAYWSRSFPQGSMNASMIPPHPAGVSDEMSSKRSIRTVLGLRVRIASMASRFQSASPQPPPMVPRLSPHRVTIILAPTSRGVEP